MPPDDDGEDPIPSPDDALAMLGNETRLEILQTLGEADEPLTFTELYERVDYEGLGNFSYHLDKLKGHFLRTVDDGYVLRQAAIRVVEAVLSGAVTERPVLEPAHPDGWRCPYCGAPAEIGYDSERVWTRCPDCPGTCGDAVVPGGPLGRADHGFIGDWRLPPAALEGRSTRELLEAAVVWGHLESLAMASGVCARCGARVERSVAVCEDHEPGEGLCDRCDCRHAVRLYTRCTNCVNEDAVPFVLGGLVATTELSAFLATHGIGPVPLSDLSRFYRAILDYHEDVRSTDPFEARFTFTLDDDALALTVDDELTVTDVARTDSPDLDRD